MNKLKKFNEFFEGFDVEQNYADNKISNKIKKDDNIQYKNQGWFFYKKDILNPYAKNPPSDGVYDVKSDFGTNPRTDVAEYEDGMFKKSKEFGLEDNQITHWKIKESGQNKYKYNKKTGKFNKKI